MESALLSTKEPEHSISHRMPPNSTLFSLLLVLQGRHRKLAFMLFPSLKISVPFCLKSCRILSLSWALLFFAHKFVLICRTCWFPGSVFGFPTLKNDLFSVLLVHVLCLVLWEFCTFIHSLFERRSVQGPWDHVRCSVADFSGEQKRRRAVCHQAYVQGAQWLTGRSNYRPRLATRMEVRLRGKYDKPGPRWSGRTVGKTAPEEVMF